MNNPNLFINKFCQKSIDMVYILLITSAEATYGKEVKRNAKEILNHLLK